MSTYTPRCGAAHDDDPSPCDSPVDSVRIVDKLGDEAFGCHRHGAALLASLEGGRVYPGSGSAIEAYRRARKLKPFEFHG